MNELTEAPRRRGTMDLTPTSFEEAFRMADNLAKSDLVPKDYKGKPGNVLVAMQMGAEVGLQPMQAIQNIAVINGRPCVWGDSLIGLVRASPLCEYVREHWDDKRKVAVCVAKRRGDEQEYRVEFGMEDANAAGLAGKQGPWTQYPKRMCQMRARSWVCRDLFADVLRGLQVAEEVMDFIDVTPAKAKGSTTIAELSNPEDDKPVGKAIGEIVLGMAGAEDEATLRKWGAEVGDHLSDDEKEQARLAWKAKAAELEPRDDKPNKAAMLRQLIDEAATVGELEGISQEVYSSGDEDLRKAYKAKKVELEMQQGESDE